MRRHQQPAHAPVAAPVAVMFKRKSSEDALRLFFVTDVHGSATQCFMGS